VPKAWLRAAPLCLVVLTVLPFLFHETATGFFSAWNGTTAYNYCFLILPICAYLVWERRERLFAANPKPSILGFLLLLGAGAVWLLGELSGTLIVSEFALVLMAQSIVLAILGIEAAFVLLFPLGYLLFLVPVGESLIPELQSVTATSAVALLKITGIPVHSDGFMIYLPNASWVVAEACAGLKFLITSIALGALLSMMFLRSWSRRALFMVLSVIVPIVANGFRAFAIVAIGYFTNDADAAFADHILYGWVVFAIVVFGMVGIAVAMREDEGRDILPRTRTRSKTREPATPSSSSVLIAALCSLFMVLSFKAGADSLAARPTNTTIPTVLPLTVRGPWIPVATSDPSPPVFLGADRVWRQAYSDGVATIHLSVGYYSSERPGAEIASSRQQLAGLAPTEQADDSWQELSIAHQTLRARALRFGAGDHQHLLWYWYWVDGRYTGNPYLAKLLQLKVKLIGGQSAAAIITISRDYAGVKDKEMTALDRFVGSLSEIGTTTRTLQDDQ
jgi:exosortase A